MEHALITHDFSVEYVSHVGSREVPLWVTIVSLWSSLEGSILFWGFILGIYIAVKTWLNRNDHQEYMPFAIGTWLSVGAFFSFLIAGPANPFLTVASPQLDGPGPNPLLQNHLLMIIHPPMLYLGYVGMTIPFGFAVAALLRGRGHRSLRPLGVAAKHKVFLTIAIMLGGCGRMKFSAGAATSGMDPAENASPLPWLTATAALHSAIAERRGVLKGWTVTLIQASFLRRSWHFMTRSGALTRSTSRRAPSTDDPVFLAAALLFPVALLSFRIDSLEAEGCCAPSAAKGCSSITFRRPYVHGAHPHPFPAHRRGGKGKQMSAGVRISTPWSY
jgi:cytochrome c-type biogenesis protein CcmF